MNNKEILEIMKEGFKGINDRLDKMEAKIDPLVEFKAKSEGSNNSVKFIIVTGIAAFAVILSLISLYHK